jgi:hypothetical protein
MRPPAILDSRFTHTITMLVAFAAFFIGNTPVAKPVASAHSRRALFKSIVMFTPLHSNKNLNVRPISDARCPS